MNAYQQKWIDVLSASGLNEWKIQASDEDILVEMPHITDLKLVRDNLPEVIAALSLDIQIPKERLKFIFKNGYELFEYVLNPSDRELNSELK